MGSIIAVVISSILALVELFVDLQPQTPKRTAPFPLMARILTGGSLRRLRLRGSESIVDHRRDSGRCRRTNRSIRRFRWPEKIGRGAEHQRYFCGTPRRSDHDRTRLLLRHPLTLISAFQLSASQRLSVSASQRFEEDKFLNALLAKTFGVVLTKEEPSTTVMAPTLNSLPPPSFLRAQLDRPRPKIHLIEIDLIQVPNGVKRCRPMRSGRQIRLIIGEKIQ